MINNDINLLLGCAFAKFKYREDAIRAFSGLRTQLSWMVDWAADNMGGRSGGTAGGIPPTYDKHSIFVGQLNNDLVSRDLLEFRFGKYGAIEDIEIHRRRPVVAYSANAPANLHQCFAYMKFKEESAAAEAVEKENGNNQLWKTLLLF